MELLFYVFVRRRRRLPSSSSSSSAMLNHSLAYINFYVFSFKRAVYYERVFCVNVWVLAVVAPHFTRTHSICEAQQLETHTHTQTGRHSKSERETDKYTHAQQHTSIYLLKIDFERDECARSISHTNSHRSHKPHTITSNSNQYFKPEK